MVAHRASTARSWIAFVGRYRVPQAYCSSYAMWREASEELAREQGLLVMTQAGDPRRSPLIKIIRDAAADMVRYAGEFGLTPVARTRIAKGIQQPPPNKFDGLLAGPREPST
jgi:P27 family predicted phage terminase small subunit